MSQAITELIAPLIDLLIIIASVLVFGFLYLRQKPMTNGASRIVKFLILGGLALIIGVHLLDVLLSVVLPSTFDFSDRHLLSTAIPDWLHWLASRVAFCMMAIGVLLTVMERRKAEEKARSSRELVKQARDRIIRSEARFRFLVDRTSNSVYCYTFDPPMPVALSVEDQVERSRHAILTECNRTYARELEAKSVDEVIGTTMGDLDSCKDARAHYKFIKAFIDNDYNLTDYEMLYHTPEGFDRALRINLTGVVRDGMLYRIWGAETNVLHVRRIKEALATRHRFQELLASISSSLVKAHADDADETVNNALREVCRYVGADRGAIGWVDHDKETAAIEYRWRTASSEPILPVFSIRLFPTMSRSVLSGKELRIADVEDVPEEFSRDRRTLERLKIRSVAVIPMKIASDVVGVATFGNASRAHEWSDDEMMDLRVFAELFASYIIRLKSRRALDEALLGLREASERLEAENVYLRQEMQSKHGFDEIIGESDSLVQCLLAVDRVAATAAPVLLLGETGTGKELLANAIHGRSDRRERPLVKVNCAALPANLIESELFGYEKGAFTGADKAKRGRFDLADGSTLFLDEIGDIPLEVQPKLLRVLQEGEFERLGGTETVKVDVRIVAATNRNLPEAVQVGKFRSDLFYRINTFPIEVPPLRVRSKDIELLAQHFAQVHGQRLGREVRAISAHMMRQLREYSWPGNVRELEGVIQRAIISSTGPVIDLADKLQLPLATRDDGMPRVLSHSIAELKSVERDHILSVLEDSDWKISGTDGAASRLGIPPSTLRSKMKKLSIDRPH